MWSNNSVFIAVIIIIILILIYYNHIRTKNVSNFVLNDDFMQKSKMLLDKGATYSEFKTYLDVDNVEYNDLKTLHRNGNLDMKNIQLIK